MTLPRAKDLADSVTTVVGRSVMKEVVREYAQDGYSVTVYRTRAAVPHEYRIIARIAQKGGAA